MSTMRVKLGERETDVLGWLVFTSPSGGTVDGIRRGIVEQGIATPAETDHGVPQALTLLRELEFVNVVNGTWYATAEGVAATSRERAS